MGCSSPPASEVLKLLAMSTGLAYFIGLILLDAWRSLWGKPHIHWIPARALILTALTLQILSYVDHKNVSIHDEPDYDEAKKLLKNQLVLDSGRLVMCVFIGYLLPRMAASGSATRWGNIAALNVSVFIAIVSELYYVRHSTPQPSSSPYEETYQFFWDAKWDDKTEEKSLKAWFAASAIVVLVATVILIVLLMSSVLAGKTISDLVSPRILSIIESTRVKSSRGKSPRVKSSSWDEFDEQIMRSWLLSRVGQPQYAISRSVLSSLAGVMVTVCIVLLVVKAIVLKSTTIIAYHDCWDWLRYVTFSLQCLFVLMGWVIILWRWFCGVVYFPKFSSLAKSAGQIRGPRWSMEDFWRRSIYELRDVFVLHNWRPTLDRQNKLWAATASAAKKCEIYLPVHFLWALQTSVVFFSKCSSFLSEKVFCSTLFRKCLVEPSKNGGDQQFKKYKGALEQVCMPGENAEDLWLANERIFNEAKHRLENKRVKGEGFQHLKTLLNQQFDSSVKPKRRFVNQLESLPLVKKYFPFLNENSWKMSAVSLLKIINRVSPSDMPWALEAYRQAWKLMTFVESSHVERPLDVEVNRLSLAADQEYKRLLRLRDPSLKKESDPSLKKDNHGTGHEAVVRLMEEAQDQLKAENMIPPPAEELQKKTPGEELEEIPQGKDIEKGEIQPFSQIKDGEAGESQQVPEEIQQILQTKEGEAGESQQVPEGEDDEEEGEDEDKEGEGEDDEEGEGEDDEEEDEDDEEEGEENTDRPYNINNLHLQDSKDWNVVASSYNMYRVCKQVLSSERALVDELHKSLADVIGHCLLQLPDALARRCTLWTVKYEEGRIWKAISITGKLRGVMEGKWTPLLKKLKISRFRWTFEEREIQPA